MKQRRKILAEDGVCAIVDYFPLKMFPFFFLFLQSDSGQWEEYMQLVFPDDEAVQPHLKLLAMAKRWKKGQEDTPTAAPESNTTTENTTTSSTSAEDDVPLPESHIDDEEMNDES